MSLPTLLVKGSLNAPPGSPPALQKKLDTIRPVDHIIDWFKTRMTRTGVANRVLILKSETASGKSTAFPAELYLALYGTNKGGRKKREPGIICTQPRIITAQRNVLEIAFMSSKEYSAKFKLGENIGWSTKHSKLRLTSTGLLSATIGTLSTQLKLFSDEQIMKMYRFILIDETHERDLQTDMTLYMLKNFLRRNADKPECPFVVLMSATFDPIQFINYFSLKGRDHDDSTLSITKNHVYVSGRAYGQTEMWDWNQGRAFNNYPQAASLAVKEITQNNQDDPDDRGDILIFLPGKREIQETARWLEGVNSELYNDGKKYFSILSLDSEAQRSENISYKRLDIPLKDHVVTIRNAKVKGSDQSQTMEVRDRPPSRRVILSTNVAETGLTLPNLKYVIDAGFNREIEHNPDYTITGLVTKPAPKSRIRQRIGRAGRKFPGVFYPLYPRYIFNQLPDQQLPQILNDNISLIVLDIIRHVIDANNRDNDVASKYEFKVEDIDMVDVPSPDAIHECIEKLYALGFIDINSSLSNDDLDIITTLSDIHTDKDAKIKDVTTIIDKVIKDEPVQSSPQAMQATKTTLTPLGYLAYRITMIPPESLRMIMASWSWDVSPLDMITIAAWLEHDDRSVITGRGGLSIYNKIVASALPKLISDGPTDDTIVDATRINMLLCDNFLHGLFLYNAMMLVCGRDGDESEPSSVVTKRLQDWCDDIGVSYVSMMNFVSLRDEIIEQFASTNFNIFANEEMSLIHAKDSTFMDVITRIKYCIYDGYRLNTLIKHDDGKWYTRHGRVVSTPAIVADNYVNRLVSKMANMKELTPATPRILLYDKLTLSKGSSRGRNKTQQDMLKDVMYNVNTSRVSAMDGFVNIDTGFIN